MNLKYSENETQGACSIIIAKNRAVQEAQSAVFIHDLEVVFVDL